MRYEFGKYPKLIFERTWHNEPYFLEDLRINRETEHAAGISPACLEVCINQYSQNIAFPELKAVYPAEVKLLEDIFATEKPVSGAMRTGEIINGNAAIILTYDVDDKQIADLEINDPCVYHAQTRMMAVQLDEALLGHCVNICGMFHTGIAGLDEICAVVSADRIPPDKRADFEKEFDAVLGRLALSKDSSWVKSQYDAFVRELNENQAPDWIPNQVLKKGCSVSDIAIEACGFLGQKLGSRQPLFDEALFSHNMDKAQKLAASVDVTKNQELLNSCLHDGALRAMSDGAKKVTLHTKSPMDSLYSPSTDCFQITKNELRSILNEMGYEKDISISSFMCSYSYETSAEIKSIYEDQHKKPLNQLLSDAEKKHINSEQKCSSQKNEQEHNL